MNGMNRGQRPALKTKPPFEGLEALPVIVHVTASTKTIKGAGALYQNATNPDEKTFARSLLQL